MSRRTDAEVMNLLRGDSALNKARAAFSGACGEIDQAGHQRTPLSPIEMRRMEFEAVERIVAAFLSQSKT
jgi:hypothetical protein